MKWLKLYYRHCRYIYVLNEDFYLRQNFTVFFSFNSWYIWRSFLSKLKCLKSIAYQQYKRLTNLTHCIATGPNDIHCVGNVKQIRSQCFRFYCSSICHIAAIWLHVYLELYRNSAICKHWLIIVQVLVCASHNELSGGIWDTCRY